MNVARVVAIGVVAGGLWGCRSGPEVARLDPRLGRVLDQRLEQLRGAFNDGSCGAIYDSADSVFSHFQPRQGWVDRCQGLRAQLGSWKRLYGRAVHNPAGHQIRWSGTGEFRRGPCHILLEYHVEGQSVQLVRWELSGQGEHMSVPPMPPLRKPLYSDGVVGPAQG